VFAVSDVYIRRDNGGTITPYSHIIDNFVYFLTNADATVTVNIDLTCNAYAFNDWQTWEIQVGFLLDAMIFINFNAFYLFIRSISRLFIRSFIHIFH